MLKRQFLKGAATALALLSMSTSVGAEELTKLKVAYMKIPPLVHMVHAQETGIFERNGLDLDLTVVNGGPELMSALASGSVDVGMTAVGIVMIARAKGLKMKAFGTGDLEAWNDIRNWIVSDEGKGITSLADLEGKTVGIVAKGSPAELQIRDHMLAAGANPDTVNFVALPFPQLPSALEVGNVDAIQVGEPFHTAIMNSQKVKPLEIAEGIINLKEGDQIALGGWFAGDAWLADEANQETAKRFLRSIIQSNRELDADRTLVNAIFERDFGMPPAVASRVPLPLNTGSLVADPATYQLQLDAYVNAGMIPKAYPVEEVVQPIEYE